MQEMTRNEYPQATQDPSLRGPEQAPVLQGIADAGQMPIDRALSLVAALSRAGTLVLTADERKILSEEFPQSDVHQLRLSNRTEDYIPHILISRRLCAALGAGQWCLVRLREWYDARAKQVYASYVLVVRGVWVGDAVAGHEYVPQNPRMDYADALEATRDIALRRIAANSLGCGDQVLIPKPTGQAATSSNFGQTVAPPLAMTEAPLTGDQVREVLDRAYKAADLGDLALSEYWRILTPQMRVAVRPYAKDLRSRANAAQAVIDQAAKTGDQMSSDL